MSEVARLRLKIERKRRKLYKTEKPAERQRISEELDLLINQYFKAKGIA